MSLSKNINHNLVLVQPRKTRPFITESFLMGRKESNQTKREKGDNRVATVRKKIQVREKSGIFIFSQEFSKKIIEIKKKKAMEFQNFPKELLVNRHRVLTIRKSVSKSKVFIFHKF